MLAEHQVTKLTTWRGEYARLLIFHRARMLTMDPETRRITNEWKWTDIDSLVWAPDDDHGLILTLRSGSPLHFRCENRASVLSDFYAVLHEHQPSIPSKIVHCTKYSRKGWHSRRVLKFGVRFDCLLQTNPQGQILSSYPYQHMTELSLCPDDQNGLILTFQGPRSHLFFTSDRPTIVEHITRARERLSLPPLPLTSITRKDYIASRRHHRLEQTSELVFERVRKHPALITSEVTCLPERKLRVTSTCLLEEDHYDVEGMRTVVSVMPYDHLRAVALPEATTLELWLRPDRIKRYTAPSPVLDRFVACLMSLTDNHIPIYGHVESPPLRMPTVNETYLLEQVVLADGYETQRAIATLRTLVRNGKTDKPFFLALGFKKPHLNWTAPSRYWDLYDPADIPLPESFHHPTSGRGMSWIQHDHSR